MVNFFSYLKAYFTAATVTIALSGVNSPDFPAFITSAQAQDGGAMMAPAGSSSEGIDDLLILLATPDVEGWEDVEAKIRVEWSRSGSHSVDYLLHRAVEAMETDDMQAALEHATALTDHAPEFAEGWSMLAKIYFHSGYYGPALDALQRTVVLNPAHFEAFSGLGVILDEMGELEAALRAFQTSAAIHPHQPHISAAIEDLEVRTGGEKI